MEDLSALSDVDDLFRHNHVEDLIKLDEQIRDQLAEKRGQLRELVSERYQEFLATGDALSRTSSLSKKIEELLSMGMIIDDNNKDEVFNEDISHEETEESVDERVLFLIETEEVLWDAIEDTNGSGKTKVSHLSRAASRYREATVLLNSHPSFKENVVVLHRWSDIVRVAEEVADACKEVILSSPELSVEETCNALKAISDIRQDTSWTPADYVQLFLAYRSESISRFGDVNQRLSENEEYEAWKIFVFWFLSATCFPYKFSDFIPEFSWNDEIEKLSQFWSEWLLPTVKKSASCRLSRAAVSARNMMQMRDSFRELLSEPFYFSLKEFDMRTMKEIYETLAGENSRFDLIFSTVFKSSFEETEDEFIFESFSNVAVPKNGRISSEKAHFALEDLRIFVEKYSLNQKARVHNLFTKALEGMNNAAERTSKAFAAEKPFLPGEDIASSFRVLRGTRRSLVDGLIMKYGFLVGKVELFSKREKRKLEKMFQGEMVRLEKLYVESYSSWIEENLLHELENNFSKWYNELLGLSSSDVVGSFREEQLTTGDDNENILIPTQLSFPLQRSLFVSCSRMRERIPRPLSVLVTFLRESMFKSFSKSLFSELSKRSRDGVGSEDVIYQIIFDIYFFSLSCSQAYSEKRADGMVEELLHLCTDMIDPINWAVRESMVKSSAERYHRGTLWTFSVLFGCNEKWRMEQAVSSAVLSTVVSVHTPCDRFGYLPVGSLIRRQDDTGDMTPLSVSKTSALSFMDSVSRLLRGEPTTPSDGEKTTWFSFLSQRK